MPVALYSHDQAGAPQLSVLAGSLIAILDAVLVNGFNSVTLTSLTRSGTVATATRSAGVTYRVGDLVRISGSSTTEWNADYKITGVGPTTFTFTVPATHAATAGGTISARIAPAGWEKPFANAGNVGCYRSAAAFGGARGFLRINDNNYSSPSGGWSSGQTAEARLSQTMTALNTWTGITQAVVWPKTRRSDNPNGSVGWWIIADERRFYLFTESFSATYGADGEPSQGTLRSAPMFFGDINTYRAGDTGHCLLAGLQDDTGATVNEGTFEAYSGLSTIRSLVEDFNTWRGAFLLRNVSLSAGPVRCAVVNLDGAQSGSAGYNADGFLPFPNPADNGLLIRQAPVADASLALRGVMPGYFLTPQALPIPGRPSMMRDVSVDGTLRDLFCVRIANSRGGSPRGAMIIDTSGPW